MTLYHGTRRGFRAGGLLLPRSVHGGPGTGAPVVGAQPADTEGYAYATESAELAWVYAWQAPGRGRPKVLRVEPVGRVEPDPEHSPAMRAYRFEAARVVEVLTTPLVTESDALAGWTGGA